VTEARWGESSPWSLGVEEELMLVDAATHAQVPAVATLLQAAEGRDLPGRFKTELFASVVELNTNVCETAQEAARCVSVIRQAGTSLAAELGLALIAAGTHPVTRPEEQEIVDEPRYREMRAYAGMTARRQGVNGLHVHVGMPSGDACLHALEGALPWLPVVLALSANSPYLAGADTGFSSNRAIVLSELPRSGAPPPFASWDEWERHVEQLVALKLPADYTGLWWDVRAHPRFGTLEFRVPDQPTAADRTAAFVALLQALAVAALDRPRIEPAPGARSVYQQNRWAAARFGPRADLIDADVSRRLPASELARELLELVAPAAERLGTTSLLAGLDPDGCEADRQLEVGREQGLDAVCADLVARSLASAA
jgi:glutamate---cysteine ligase / carboxylate-amine ligase